MHSAHQCAVLQCDVMY